MRKSRFQNLTGKFSEGKKLFALKDEPNQVTIMIHGIVGDSWEGMDSKTLVSSIHEASGKLIVLDINTPGGLVFDAISIYTALTDHVGGVRADITGAAESSGTILASAADKIRIAQSGWYMIHNAWTFAVGNKRQLAEMAAELDIVDGVIADLLSDRSGMTKEDVTALMDGKEGSDGTSFTGSEAVEKGFADELIPNKKKPTATNKTPFKRHAALTTLSRLKAA